MGRHSRHYTDLNPLEGGGSGGGRGSGIGKVAEGAAVVGSGAGLMAGPIINAMQSGEKIQKKEREAAAEMKRESRDKEESMTAGQKQSMQEAKDEEEYQKRKTAPTTKTEMGKGMKKGGMTASSRADGCATKGKTKGRFV
jgi:hypothetical protein